MKSSKKIQTQIVIMLFDNNFQQNDFNHLYVKNIKKKYNNETKRYKNKHKRYDFIACFIQ